MRFLWLILPALLLVGSPVTAEPIYLALGDSSAFGETNRTQNPSNGDRGYVAPFANALAGVYSQRPTVMNFAINGETSNSYFSGQYASSLNPIGRISPDGQSLNTNYNGLPDPTSQYARMQAAFNGTNNGNVRAITVQFGANNLDAAASTPGFLGLTPAQQQAIIAAALAQVQSDYINILGDLRARFPNADIYALGYHNPYNGDPSHPFYPLADPAVRGLNQVIEGVSSVPQFNARYVDVYGAIHPNEATLTLMNTWQTDPVNYVHLNDAGYAAVGNQLIRTAAVPEPATVTLFGLGGLALLVRGRWRKPSGV